MRKMLLILTSLTLLPLTWALEPATTAQDDPPEPIVRVLVEGLFNPIGMARLPDGSLFIAEVGTGASDLSAGVSLRLPDGTVGRYISGIRSGRDSGDLTGVALVGLSPDHDTLYIGNFAAGHLWTVDLSGGPVMLPAEPHSTDDLTTAMEPLNRVMLTNPFDITFDADGVPVVADSSQNGVAKELPDGTTRFFHRFDPLVNPTDDRLTIDPVPTGIARVGDEYYVALTGGCPFPAGGGELVAIDEARNQRTVIDNLNMPIDVAVGPDGTVWVLEFARFAQGASCFTGSGYLPETGRLSRITPDGTLEPVVENLDFPGAVLPLPDGSLYVSEIFDGEILHITFDGVADESAFDVPQLDIPQPQYIDIDDMDAALRAIIAEHNLMAYPGQDRREGDTSLAALGRDLFFDPILSGDQNISCASCHHPALAMADGRVLPIGTGGHGLGEGRDFLTHVTLSGEYSGREAGDTVNNPAIGMFVPRNSASIINSALLPVQFWDGRVESYAIGSEVRTLEAGVNTLGLTDALVAQALFPITSRVEMAGATFGEDEAAYIRSAIVRRLDANPVYSKRFREVFGHDAVTQLQVVEALAAFERRFIFTAAPWDDYIAGADDALTVQQKRGALLFYGVLNPQVNCAQCHSGDMLTDVEFHNLLVPQLGPGKGHGPNGREDWGRAGATFDWRDRYKFRTPPLRNVALTAPYFHTGAYATLEDTIWHHANIWVGAADYDPSAHLPDSFFSSLRPMDLESRAYTAAPQLVNGLPLSEQDVADLAAFLHALTDPAATDLLHHVPGSVPSGLPLDPLPQTQPVTQRVSEDNPLIAVTTNTVARSEDWHFRDVAGEVGLDFTHGAFQFDLYEDPAAMMGAGLCWIDYDNDGWLDLYLVNSHAEDEYDALAATGALPHNRLFRNVEGQFIDQTAASGTGAIMRGNGCLAADFDMDGWTDLYVTADGPNLLYRNQGDGTFRTEDAGIAAPEWNSVAAAADLNGDSLPDLFVGAYIDLEHQIPQPMGAFPQDYYGLPDRIYLNEGVGPDGALRFREVTTLVGYEREERTLGAIFSDVDRDGDLDLYVANDGQPNRMYEYVPLADDPHGAGFRLIDLTHSADVGDAGSGMGVAGADYDGDGLFDLFVTNWEAELNALYRNETHEQGYINFRYSTYRIGMRGLGNNLTGWGTSWADFDHDTDIDLLTVNGRVPVTNFETDPEPVHLYGNRLVETGRPHYLPWHARVGLEDVGLLMARGSATADYDNDGDLDIAINSIGGAAVLLENDGVIGNWLQIAPSGFYPGTVVTVTLPDGRELVRELHAGSSYLASEDTRLHFGLGDATTVPVVTVRFPDETEHTLRDVAANQRLIVTSPAYTIFP